MSLPDHVSRRRFLGGSLAAAGMASAIGASSMANAARAAEGESDAAASTAPAPAAAESMPYGMIGKAKISRLLLGGNLVSGCMHSRDLKYVNQLFRAYVTEEKIFETLQLAEEHGINTVFETGANFVQKYNREFGGHMQFIPHIQVEVGQSEQALKDHIKQQVDTGAVALYVWGVAGGSR